MKLQIVDAHARLSRRCDPVAVSMVTACIHYTMNRKDPLPSASHKVAEKAEHTHAAGGGAGRITTRGTAAGKSAGERVIRYKTCLHNNTIGDVLRARGWQEVKEGESDWDFYWCDVAWMREHFDQIYLEEHQRVCHFRNHYELTR